MENKKKLFKRVGALLAAFMVCALCVVSVAPINAFAAGNTVSGWWQFTTTRPGVLANTTVSFTTKSGINVTAIECGSDGVVMYTTNLGGFGVNGGGDKWMSGYDIINFGSSKTVTSEFYTWLTTYAEPYKPYAVTVDGEKVMAFDADTTVSLQVGNGSAVITAAGQRYEYTYNGDYRFVGFTSAATGNSANYKPGNTYNIALNTNNLTLAIRTCEVYPLMINPNGGTWSDKKEVTTIWDDGSGSFTVADPTRPGYDFKGWSFTGDGAFNGSVYQFSSAGAGTLKANWKQLPIHKAFLAAITSVFSGVGKWVVSSINSLTRLFYSADSGLTFIGVLSVTGLAFSVVFILIKVLRRFLTFIR